MNSAVLNIDVDDGGGGIQQSKSVVLNMQCQETDHWCWAAVAQAIEDFRGVAVTQTDVSTAHVAASQPNTVCSIHDPPNATSQCGGPCQGSCNSPHILSRVLTERNRLASFQQMTPTFSDIVDAIDDGRPLPVRIRIDTGAGGGHFICVVGYADDGAGNQFVDVLDPLVPGVGQGAADLQTIPFVTFVGGQYDIQGDQGTPNFIYKVS